MSVKSSFEEEERLGAAASATFCTGKKGFARVASVVYYRLGDAGKEDARQDTSRERDAKTETKKRGSGRRERCASPLQAQRTAMAISICIIYEPRRLGSKRTKGFESSMESCSPFPEIRSFTSFQLRSAQCPAPKKLNAIEHIRPATDRDHFLSNRADSLHFRPIVIALPPIAQVADVSLLRADMKVIAILPNKLGNKLLISEIPPFGMRLPICLICV